MWGVIFDRFMAGDSRDVWSSSSWAERRWTKDYTFCPGPSRVRGGDERSCGIGQPAWPLHRIATRTLPPSREPRHVPSRMLFQRPRTETMEWSANWPSDVFHCTIPRILSLRFDFSRYYTSKFTHSCLLITVTPDCHQCHRLRPLYSTF